VLGAATGGGGGGTQAFSLAAAGGLKLGVTGGTALLGTQPSNNASILGAGLGTTNASILAP
jgi:hypothetical protein